MLKIRPAKRGEAKALMQVHREAVFAKAGAYYDQARLEAWSPGATPERVTQVEKQIADPDYIVLAAEAGVEIVGFAIALPAKNELRALYVKPNPAGGVF